MKVLKRSGALEDFKPEKLHKWLSWGSRHSDDPIKKQYELFNELVPVLVDGVSTEEINQQIIKICLDKEDIAYSRIASEIEKANIFKSQENVLGIMSAEKISFTDFVEVMHNRDAYDGDWIDSLWGREDEVNAVYYELEAIQLEYWTIKQFAEKYSIRIDDEAVETPAQAAMGIALALHGGACQEAYDLAKAICEYKINMPTPVMNGCRDGNFDTISCSVIEGGDTVDSLEVASHLASAMTAKKAGIGITLDTRSKNDKVKNGKVKHLGKHPLYKDIETAVKKFTQLTRGGSATITIKCIDPDIMDMLKWKTQRIDLSQRIDKVDYSLAYNNSFGEALLNNDDWYLFSKADAPEVHAAFAFDNYDEVVKQALREGVKHKKVKAWDLLFEYAKSRSETSRLYHVNVSRMNDHTPFDPAQNGEIKQSNLCMEIALPTTPFDSMFDIYDRCPSFLNESRVGEIAYCSLVALNVGNIEDEEYQEIAYIALLAVTRMIQKAATHALSPYVRDMLLARMSVGAGITGLASRLYKEGLDYDGSPESLERVEFISELHYYSLLKASQRICEEGISPAVKGIKKDWLPIDTLHSYRHPVLDWEELRGKPRAHSVLVAHMPTESSSLFSNATNGVYPCRDRVMYKKARKGAVQFICEYFDPKTHLTAWDVDMVPYYQAIQNFTDQAISADYWVDFTKYPNKKYPISAFVRWFIRQYLAGIKTAYYQNNIDSRGEEVQLEETCTDGGCKL